MPLKDKHNVQNVHVSLSLLCPRVLLIVTTVLSPDAVCIFGPWLILHSRMVSICSLRWLWFVLTSMLKRYFLQHGLGTPYCNSACFDKEDIWKFCSFLYSACQLHLFCAPPPPPPPPNRTGLGLALGLPRPIIDISKKRKKKKDFPSTQVHGLFQVFQEKD